MPSSQEYQKDWDVDYRTYVGAFDKYDIIGASQFNLLTLMGLRDYHKLLDIGCGSLRGGKLFIPYLNEGNYYGIEPNRWLITEAIQNETGKDIIKVKKPHFDGNTSFKLSVFCQKFDFILAQSVFSHTSPSQLQQCFKEIPLVLNDNGMCLATFFVGRENYNGDKWIYPGKVFYTKEFIQKIATKHGLSVMRLDWKHPSKQTWFVFFHPKNHQNVKNLIKTHLKTTHKNPLKNMCKDSKILNNSLTRQVYSFLKSKFRSI